VDSCHLCGDAPGTLWSCCGDPTDGHAGTGCLHEDGQPTCGPCGADQGWWNAGESERDRLDREARERASLRAREVDHG